MNKFWLSIQKYANRRSRWSEIDRLPSAMRGRDRPASSRSQDYSGRSRVADHRRRGASLISLPPEMTANGCVTVSRYPGMRPALAASASREHLALSLVALHHHSMEYTRAHSIADRALYRKKTRRSWNKRAKYILGWLALFSADANELFLPLHWPTKISPFFDS